MAPFLLLHFSFVLPDYIICNIAIYANDTTVYSKCYQASDLWQQAKLASELESDLQGTVDWGGSGLLIQCFKNSWFCLTCLITMMLLIRKWMGLCY